MIPLPIDAHIDQIVEHVRRSRAAVVTAAPGAGKTTRVPPALMADGPVILLQPRRVAARAIAARIADERGWTLGREVGWQVRFERRFSTETRLLVVTEGVLTARLQTDPLLSDFTTIVLDEFHERSVHADLAIALARQAWRARADLRIVVMSATLESTTVSAFLDGCPVIDVPGRAHPLDMAYAPEGSMAEAAADVLAATDGQVLCFLPGAPEIRRAMTEIQQKVGGAVEVVPLHGSLDADAQDLALRPSSRRRVVVATNIAETSLTVPGVTAVVDSGLHKVARYDADRGIDSLETERITADAADQRAGRAGRLGPGIVRRLWDMVRAAGRGRGRGSACVAGTSRACGRQRPRSAIRNLQRHGSPHVSRRTSAPRAAPPAARADSGRGRRRASNRTGVRAAVRTPLPPAAGGIDSVRRVVGD
ncbi:MAG: hypothetical protein DMF96_22015 [Acidobacteria bacterium]|nr:MAG: hypothetical protein DMF96_22015 [Acidobacteriota bacterium]